MGRSLAPVVADPRAEHRSVVHAMLLEGQMARSRDLKLNFYADDRFELYDLATDPGETVNRYDDPAYRDRRQELLEEIARVLIRHPRIPDLGGNGFFESLPMPPGATFDSLKESTCGRNFSMPAGLAVRKILIDSDVILAFWTCSSRASRITPSPCTSSHGSKWTRTPSRRPHRPWPWQTWATCWQS